MQKKNTHTTDDLTAEKATYQSDYALKDAPPKKQKRTAGLKLLDTFLYPFLNNFAVFAISLVATYLTSHGDQVGGKVGQWFYDRGESFTNFVQQKFGMNEEQADMTKMVFFSFVDGSVMAPVIKVVEDRREKIARGLDTMLGTLPADESVYTAEPKQTWKSVLLGRAATSAIVVPTAVALDKTGLNKILFTDPGLKWGKSVEENYPGIAKRFANYDLPGLFKIGVFEMFYTSVCTAGLYFSSRMIAGYDDNKDAVKQPKPQTATPETTAKADTHRDQAHEADVASIPKEEVAVKAEAAPREEVSGSAASDRSANQASEGEHRPNAAGSVAGAATGASKPKPSKSKPHSANHKKSHSNEDFVTSRRSDEVGVPQAVGA